MSPALRDLETHFASSEHLDLVGGDLELWPETYRTLQGYEAWAHHGPWIESHDQALTGPVSTRFDEYRGVSAADYRRSLDTRQTVRNRVDGVLGDNGIIALPTVPSAAPLRDADATSLEDFRAGALTLTCSAGLSGCPQITIPLGIVDGAPLGLSLIGPRGRDSALIALARQILGR